MKEEEAELELFPLWVDRENKIVSFHQETGFEIIRFQSRTERMKYAMHLANNGFALQ